MKSHKIYQILKFLGNKNKNIFFVFAICNQTNQNNVNSCVSFCTKIIDLLPQLDNNFLNTQICTYQYYQNIISKTGEWSSDLTQVKSAVGSLFFNFSNFYEFKIFAIKGTQPMHIIREPTLRIYMKRKKII